MVASPFYGLINLRLTSISSDFNGSLKLLKLISISSPLGNGTFFTTLLPFCFYSVSIFTLVVLAKY